ncbi:MAG: accessory gene regulator B family protein [Lachnospiraceae bacterium]|nr:accessory gene regulator B family protein [Lachnospiraceae bacterium]
MLSNIIAFYLYKNNYIKEDEIKIYRYGFAILLNSLNQIIVLIIFGFIFEQLLETVVFLFVFIITRRYVGGYHASKKITCIALDIILWMISCGFRTSCKILQIHNAVLFLMIFFSLMVIFIYAPLENPHKRLSYRQISKNKIYGRLTVLVFSIMDVILIIAGLKIYYVFTCTLFLVGILILAGRRKYAKGTNV